MINAALKHINEALAMSEKKEPMKDLIPAVASNVVRIIAVILSLRTRNERCVRKHGQSE